MASKPKNALTTPKGAPKLPAKKKTDSESLFDTQAEDLFGEEEKAQQHKYGRNYGEGLSRKKAVYNRERALHP